MSELNQQHDAEAARLAGNNVSPDSGAQERRLQDQIARQDAAAQTINLQRQITERTISMQNEAVNAGLQGGALLMRQKEQAEDAVRRSATGTAAQIDAIELKYHNDQMKRIADETDAIAKRARAEQEAGLTGLARLQAEGQDKLSDVNDREKRGLYSDQTAPGQTSALATQDRATATTEMYRKMSDAEIAYTKTASEENDRVNGFMLSGFAKIDQEQAQSIQKRADQFTEMYGQLSHDDARYIAGQQQLEQDESAIHANGERARSELTMQVHDQTLQMDREASAAEQRVREGGLAGWVSSYRSSLAEIQAAEQERLGKINQDQQKQGGDPSEYEQRKVDADRMANAQIAELNQQLRQQVASTLQGAFDDPVHYIQNKMKAMFFQILADFLMQSKAFAQLFGSTMGDLKVGGSSGVAGGATAAIERSMGIGTQGISTPAASGTAAQAAGMSRAVQMSSGTAAPGGYSSSSTTATADLSNGYSSTFSLAGIPRAGGGTTATPGGMIGDATSLGQTGMAAAQALSGGTAASPAAMGVPAASDSYNGEDGGFAGYMTGDPDASGSSAMANADGSQSIGSAAAGQVQGINANIAAAGMGDTAGSQALGVVGAAAGVYSGTKGVIGAFESGQGEVAS